MRRFLFRSAVVVTTSVLVISVGYVTTRLLTSTPLTEGCTVQVQGGETKLDVTQAENASLISAVAVRQGHPRRAATVALTTAYQESGLRNLDHGDRDSLGLFQQRPSQGWGKPGQISDPYYSTQAFYDHLAEVDYERMPVAKAAQQVQRSADGTAYAQHEANAEALSGAFTGRDKASFSCRLSAEPTPSPAALEAGTADGSRTDRSSGTSGDASQDRTEHAGSTEAIRAGDGQDAAGESGDQPDASGDGPSEPTNDPRHAGGQQTPDGSARPDDSGNEEEPGADETRRSSDSENSQNSESADSGDGAGDSDGAGGTDQPDDADGTSGGSPTDEAHGEAAPSRDEKATAPDRSGLLAQSRSAESDADPSPAEAVQQELEQAFGSDLDERPGSDIAPPEGADGAPSAPGEDSGDAARENDRTRNAPDVEVRLDEDGDQVRVVVGDQRVGWAVAHWAVANTQRLGITEVAYDNRTWTAEDSAEGWLPSDGAATDDAPVRIVLG